MSNMTWRWDQGHLPYFQFHAVRDFARYAVQHNLRVATREDLRLATGLCFAAPETHAPWRNYARVFKATMLVAEIGGRAEPTAVAQLLAADDSMVTADEYMHYLVTATTEPSPVFSNWSASAEIRYPLLFALKYLLAKTAIGETGPTSFNELIVAFQTTGTSGDESWETFEEWALRASEFADGDVVGDARQARESLRVMCQISYLHLHGKEITVSLAVADATKIFLELQPIVGVVEEDPESEIVRRAQLFSDGTTYDFFDYAATTVDQFVESGFVEGSRIMRSHVITERNSGLRRAFFRKYPTTSCDICKVDTQSVYPWVKDRVLDLHHLLPLSSSARIGTQGTRFDDLVAVCPTCHRAVHRYYQIWLEEQGQADFASVEEAKSAYDMVKSAFGGSST